MSDSGDISIEAEGISSTDEEDDDFFDRLPADDSQTFHPPPGDPSLLRPDQLHKGHSLREKFPETSPFHHLQEERPEPTRPQSGHPLSPVLPLWHYKQEDLNFPPEQPKPGHHQPEDEVFPPPKQQPKQSQPFQHNTTETLRRSNGDNKDTSPPPISSEEEGERPEPTRPPPEHSQSEGNGSPTPGPPYPKPENSNSTSAQPKQGPSQPEDTVSQSQANQKSKTKPSRQTKGDNQDTSQSAISSEEEEEPNEKTENPQLRMEDNKDTMKSPYYDDTDIHSKCLHIKFDVLLHPSTREGTKKTKLRLQCLANLNGKKLKLETLSQREICNDSKYQRYVGEAQIPRQWLNESHRLQYIYEISSDGRNWKPEYWHDTEANVRHRVLSFSIEELRSLDEWENQRGTTNRETADVHDGVILIDDRNSIRKAFSPGIDQRVLINTVEIVCDEYLPSLEDEHFSMREFLNELKEKQDTMYDRYFSPRNIS
ncbi:RNA-binding protein 33-like, partial [Mizuhopecten yessoensis]|uniref:RNA-binding protein 33-like n=1 Tax=Mizuhopecten yessoensis TaxID=6573 RepID=UPI000B457C64